MNFAARGASFEKSMMQQMAKKPFPVIDGHVIKPGAKLAEANLSGANLHNANLYRANLHGADLIRADLHNANLHGADLRDANLYGADLHNANLYRADLRDANLIMAQLIRADLQGVNLQGAYLAKANLHGAHLYSAELHGADLRGAKLGDIREAFVTGAKVVNGRGREIELRNFSDLPSQVAKKEGRFDQWIKRDRSGEGPAAITRPAVNP